MVFRRYSLLYFEYLFLAAIVFITALFLVPLCFNMGTFDGMISMLLFILLGACIISNIHKVDSEKLEINEKGIRCIRQNTTVCFYRWDEIEALMYGHRLRNPSVDVILRSSRDQLSNKSDFSVFYFQLGRDAKRAIIEYSPYEIKKRSR